ncbi:MAG: hypothetical protein ACD_51C00341G0001 [uncultured bacterium]|nr:MAG: hypothetical protein ACD_51C00341G0001 [uncultured bacterium]OGJ47601.1 MAG: hypothetical protein A2244_00870 [Candidatus Peregrinibacteria bacterium RIFOXYA2_FULL_41_18]OGJ49598.1 MAG: hypothetical protein A2344_02240 [Candidatus Peregrinibacteria bacterium RIFOXYB12_FULL_41_12]OGJ52816.1 MAG: hypothetical protein A2336_03475 [Candidatus Peregrinibacteria bacterium RIFOXYB2_FULL_41_88]OGJ53040.1 MAG: hypothetical protein A2448_01195 [Candidatus Peregrinibacteria bacterium RIFOXYC2_FULL
METNKVESQNLEVQHGDILIVGIRHFLNPEEKVRLESHIKNADIVCIEWDSIRDNEARKLTGGYKEHFRTRPFSEPRLEGDTLITGVFDSFIRTQIRLALNSGQARRASHNNGTSSLYDPEGNEFLYIQELCARYGVPCHFVDKPITHTYQAILEKSEYLGIAQAFDEETKSRSKHMIRKTEEIQRTTSEKIGHPTKCVLFVGASHIKDFSRQ